MKRAPLLYGRCGSVLIVVLWASVGLVSVALLLGNSMLLNYRSVDNELAARQADAAIEGAIRYAQTLLAQPEIPGALPDLTSYEGEAVPVGEGTFWFLGRADDGSYGGTREFALVDEASRLNINTVSRETLLLFPGMTEDLASAIEEYRTAGADAVAGTTVKAAPFETVDELALVPGMTRDILYGEDTNGNGVLDANEDDGETSLPADNSDGRLDPGLAESFTTFAKEPANRADGSPRIPVAALTSQQAMQPVREMIAEVLPESAPPALTPRADGYGSVLEFIAFHRGQSALTEEDWDKIAGNLVSRDPQTGQPLMQGLVNVNTASETVLAALLDEATAADIVAARASRTVPSTGFTWVLEHIPPNFLNREAAYLTGQTFFVSVDVAAVGRHGRGYRRTRVVFDTTNVAGGELPRIVYRRDLGGLGWALGRETREQLALKREVR